VHRIERVLRAIDRFQQRHSVLGHRSLLQQPLTEPDRRVLTALAQTEERRPEQRVEVTFVPEAGDRDDQVSHDADPG
jgi:hypothetical protein